MPWVLCIFTIIFSQEGPYVLEKGTPLAVEWSYASAEHYPTIVLIHLPVLI